MLNLNLQAGVVGVGGWGGLGVGGWGGLGVGVGGWGGLGVGVGGWGRLGCLGAGCEPAGGGRGAGVRQAPQQYGSNFCIPSASIARQWNRRTAGFHSSAGRAHGQPELLPLLPALLPLPLPPAGDAVEAAAEGA